MGAHGYAVRATGLARRSEAFVRRTPMDLLEQQLVAIDRCAAAALPVPEGVLSREEKMDHERRAAARRREQEAMRDRAARALSSSGGPMASTVPPRAVLVHRDAWWRGKVAAGLRAAGVEVLAELDNGADGCGVVLAEQPEIVLLEDLLPTVTGLDVLRRLSLLAPGSFVGVQVHDTAVIHDALTAGAGAAFTRLVAPEDVVTELLRCLVEQV